MPIMKFKRMLKKMADGGEVEDSMSDPMEDQRQRMDMEEDEKEPYNQQVDEDSEDSIDAAKKHMYAEGGKVMQHPKSIADAIMGRRKAKMMADGGEVDIEDNGMEIPDEFDDMNEDATLKELYDDNQLESQPEDSNEHGDGIESDLHDMISSIRKKMRLKRGE
jgi:hypothetical protein